MINLFIEGTALGLLFAIVTLGVALVFGVLGLINFAQGVYVTTCAYVVLTFQSFSIIFALAAALGAGVILAVLTERLAFRKLPHASPETLLVTSFAVSVIIQNLLISKFGTQPQSSSFLAELSQPISLGPARPPMLDLASLGVCLVVIPSLVYLVERTSFGVALRAVASDREMSAVVGMNTRRLVVTTFALSGALAAIAGVLILAKNGTASPDMGTELILIAFVAVILGGMGSLYGAALGAFLLGFILTALQYVLPVGMRSYGHGTMFAIVLALILIFPNGISLRRSATRV